MKKINMNKPFVLYYETDDYPKTVVKLFSTLQLVKDFIIVKELGNYSIYHNMVIDNPEDIKLINDFKNKIETAEINEYKRLKEKYEHKA
ncbi:MAG TPA: hypothetical protein PKL04_00620 [Methanofastidiosum sp.]|nr:hypothetical protein [Methanofastidiosum sp.]